MIQTRDSILARRTAIRRLAAKLDSIAGHDLMEVDLLKKSSSNNSEGVEVCHTGSASKKQSEDKQLTFT